MARGNKARGNWSSVAGRKYLLLGLFGGISRLLCNYWPQIQFCPWTERQNCHEYRGKCRKPRKRGQLTSFSEDEFIRTWIWKVSILTSFSFSRNFHGSFVHPPPSYRPLFRKEWICHKGANNAIWTTTTTRSATEFQQDSFLPTETSWRTAVLKQQRLCKSSGCGTEKEE